MLRYGKINTADPTKGRYKVEFVEDQDHAGNNLITASLPCVTINSLMNKAENPLDVGESVVVIMDENCEEGVILGAYNDKDNLPVFANQDQSGITYKDGSFIKYDRAAKKYTASFEGDVEIVKSSNITVACSGTIEFNGGAKNGLPMVAPLVTKINALENLVNSILNVLKSTTIPLAPTGTYPFAPLYTALADILPITAQADIENTDITQ